MNSIIVHRKKAIFFVSDTTLPLFSIIWLLKGMYMKISFLSLLLLTNPECLYSVYVNVHTHT